MLTRVGLIQGPISPKEILNVGLNMIGNSRKNCLHKRHRCFLDHFGCAPEIASSLWIRIKLNKTSDVPAQARPQHLLWALLFMKVYSTESVLCSLCGGIDEKSFRKWKRIFIIEIAKLAPSEVRFNVYYFNFIVKKIVCLLIILLSFFNFLKIRWENRKRGAKGSICMVTVDGTDFRVKLVKGFWKKYWSHKFHSPGLRYEVAISIAMGEIVHINGPFPCGEYNDIKIFRMGLKKKLKLGVERVEADDGYMGERFFVERPKDGCMHHKIQGFGLNQPCPGCMQHFSKQRIRSRQETCNKRFKQWGILNQRYRHDLKFHGSVFTAIATITQIDIRSGKGLFYCAEYKTQESTARAALNRKIARRSNDPRVK